MTKQQNKISSINSGALDHHDISTLMWHFFYFNELLSLHSDVFFPVIFNVSKLIDSLKHYTKNLLTVNQNDSMRLDKDRIFLPTNGDKCGYRFTYSHNNSSYFFDKKYIKVPASTTTSQFLCGLKTTSMGQIRQSLLIC